MEPVKLLSLILLTPLVAAAVIALFFRRSAWGGAVVSVLSAAIIMVTSLVFIFQWDGQTLVGEGMSWHWLTLGALNITMGFYIDKMAVTMLLVVSFVAFWIHIFSVGYMDDDPAKGRYFGGLSIFMFSILGIVLADNLIMLFVFWELVGFSSYMLVAHYYKTDFAKMASKKAFIVNRIGDFGFIIGIAWAWNYYGSTDLYTIQALIESGDKSIFTGIGMLLMCGFLGKSAQFPLQVWLTDAMAGPTPVSALIHAATMVAAGIYFLARIFFMLSPAVQDWILWSGAIMTAFAGLCALGQRDIKKSLAYSTLSHLGYMATAVGLALPGLALFHMAMHACFKATLFLCAGSIIHQLHHEQDMFKMGGLWKKMPITFGAFLIAALSIAAFPYTAGFFSKDTIISAAFWRGAETGASHYYVVYGIILFAALCTSLYMGRMLWTVFFGQANSEHARHAREGSAFMALPLIVLGALSLGAGWFVFGWDWAGGKMDAMLPAVATLSLLPEFNEVHAGVKAIGEHVEPMLFAAGALCCVGGFIFTFFFYGRGSSEDRLAQRSPLLYTVLEKHGWFDDFYDWYVTKVQQRFADLVGFFDLILISGLLVRGTAGVVGLCGLITRSLHVGSIHGYVYWFLAGLILFSAFAFGWIG